MIMFCWMALLHINHALQGAGGGAAGAGTLDPLVAALDAGTASAHDKEASQALGSKGFLKEFLNTAPTPEGKEMGLEEAAKLFRQPPACGPTVERQTVWVARLDHTLRDVRLHPCLLRLPHGVGYRKAGRDAKHLG